MGRAENPVRAVLNYASDRFLGNIPIVYVLTVVGLAADGGLAVRGVYIGDDAECFHLASDLSLKVNFEMLEKPIHKAIVYLDPHEFHSTWLGNKAVYRTRMALADNADLIILAPGVREFGEDPTIDRLIRKYGYRGTPATLAAVENNADLAADLSAAAHLIHASSEGRFNITWCPAVSPAKKSRAWASSTATSLPCSPATIPKSFSTAITPSTAKKSSSSPIPASVSGPIAAGSNNS